MDFEEEGNGNFLMIPEEKIFTARRQWTGIGGRCRAKRCVLHLLSLNHLLRLHLLLRPHMFISDVKHHLILILILPRVIPHGENRYREYPKSPIKTPQPRRRRQQMSKCHWSNLLRHLINRYQIIQYHCHCWNHFRPNRHSHPRHLLRMRKIASFHRINRFPPFRQIRCLPLLG